ncbi:MAG: DNA repair protein RecO [bacterium]|nr:DNA repair protein RecO [bacterium]
MYSKYTGVILKKHPLGEADELLTIFTKETGKLRVKAVSSRKIRSRLAGHLQSLNEIQFEVAGRGSLPVLISVRGTRLNNYLRENLKKFAYALIGAETLYRLSPDRQEQPEAYENLIRFFVELGETRLENDCLRKFQIRLLQIMGFGVPPGISENNIDNQALDGFMHDVLERDIRSNAFLREVTENNF